MSKMQNKRRNDIRPKRIAIVSELKLKHYTVRQIRAEVMKRLDLSTYSMSTVQGDIQACLKEWQEERLDNTEQLVTEQLAIISNTCRELWEQWEKSKEDYVRTKKKRKGIPQFGDDGGKTKTTSIETTENTVIGLGNVAYIAEIRAQLQEYRKLLGLYAPEKRELSGGLSFANLLMESSMLDEAEAQSTEFDL